MKKVNILYLIVFLIALYEINTAQGLWVPGLTTNVERVSSIIETKNGDIYASGFDGVYRTQDLGNSWYRMSQTGTNIKLKVDKNDNIYKINNNGVSSDSGKSWNEIDILIDGQKIRPYLLDVNADGNLVAITERSGIIYYSNSSNDEWKILNELPDRINYIAFDNKNRILAFSDIGIFISDGVEKKFNKVNNGFSYVDDKFWGKSTNISGITYNQKGDIFVITRNMGVFKGNSSATEWVSKNNGLSSESIQCITINSKEDLFLCTEGYKNIYRSTDNGDNWIKTDDRFDANSVDVIYSNKNDLLFIGCYSGIFISTDNGDSWLSRKQWEKISAIKKIIIDNEGAVFVATDQLYKTTDEGKSWEFLSKDVLNQIYSLAIKDSLLIVGTSEGMYYSINCGNNWTKTECFNSISIYDILILSRDQIYVTSEYGVLSITDLFRNCQLMNKYLINGKPTILESSRTEYIKGEKFPILGYSTIKKHYDDFYLCAERQLFKLKDNAVWEYINEAESFEILSDGNMIVEYQGILYLIDTINKSVNKIERPGYALTKFFIDNTNRVYISVVDRNNKNKKLYFSKDYGVNWIDITFNLYELEPNINITELTKTKDGNLIIGTSDHGPFFSKDIRSN